MQGPGLVCSRLLQALPLVPELADLLLHQIRGGVQLADQLLTHLLKQKVGAHFRRSWTENSVREHLTPQVCQESSLGCQSASQMLENYHLFIGYSLENVLALDRGSLSATFHLQTFSLERGSINWLAAAWNIGSLLFCLVNWKCQRPLRSAIMWHDNTLLVPKIVFTVRI